MKQGVVECWTPRLAQVSTMSITESEAKFSARAQKLGLKNDAVQLLADGGVNALAKFAYVSSFIPGQSDEAPFVRAIRSFSRGIRR